MRQESAASLSTMAPTIVAGIAGSVSAVVVVAIIVAIVVILATRSKRSPKVHDRTAKKTKANDHDDGGETTGQSDTDTRTKLNRTSSRECWGANS